jgi:hypothetical protein
MNKVILSAAANVVGYHGSPKETKMLFQMGGNGNLVSISRGLTNLSNVLGNNVADVDQTGTSNDSDLDQLGNQNDFKVTQNGWKTILMFLQEGNNNKGGLDLIWGTVNVEMKTILLLNLWK